MQFFHNFGFKRPVQKLLSSYLKNGKQKVRIDNSLSLETHILCIVSQGTIHSPTSFNILINRINDLKINGKLVSYTDDTVLFIESNTWDEVFTRVKDDLRKINILQGICNLQYIIKNNLISNNDHE